MKLLATISLLFLSANSWAACPPATGSWLVDIDSPGLELMGMVYFHEDEFFARLQPVTGYGVDDGFIRYEGAWERGEACSLILVAKPFYNGWVPAELVLYFSAKNKGKIALTDPEYSILGSGDARRVWYLRDEP